MHKYTLDEGRRIAMNCAKQYQANLFNKKYLFLYKDLIDDDIKYIEVQFKDINYQHLTGIDLIDKDGNIRKNVASLFYKKCLTNTLRKDEIRFKSDGTTHLKLLALPIMMNIQKITKIVGNYNHTRTYLVADKLIGNTNFCLGLKELNDIYVPISALLENIKNLTFAQSQVLAIFSKNISDSQYNTIRYISKGINLHHLKLSTDIMNKIELENYVPKFSS